MRFAGGFESKLTAARAIDQFPDPQTQANLSVITVRHVALKQPTLRAPGCEHTPSCAQSLAKSSF